METIAHDVNVKNVVKRRPRYWVPIHTIQFAGISTKERMKKLRKYRLGKISMLRITHPYVIFEAILKIR